MKTLRISARIIIGLVFIFSGFVKAVDPLGTTYKFVDYFNAFGLSFLEGLAFPMAILLNGAEFIIGIALLLGIRMKIFSKIVFGFLIFFLILTLIIALTNPVSDCGCFGDALVLTNWQTFWKNVVFTLIGIIIILSSNKYKEIYNAKTEWIIISVFVVFIMSISVYAYKHLPLIDFRPYHIGSNIDEKSKIPEGEKPDKYIYNYTMKNSLSSEEKVLTSDEYMETKIWEDTTWKIIETEGPILTEKGYTPPIHDFEFTDKDGGTGITDELLYGENYSFLLVAYNIKKTNINAFNKANEIALFCEQYGYNFYAASASTDDEISKLKTKVDLLFNIYSADETMLKTIVRSNPGLILMKNGVVINKWHYNDFPNSDELKENLLSLSVSDLQKRKESLFIFSLILCGLIAFSLFQRIRETIKSNNNC